MLIYGEKIVIRGWVLNDNKMLLDLINDPETEMMLGGSSWPVSESEQRRWFEHQENSRDIFRGIVALKEEQEKALGTIILNEIDQKNGTGHIHIKMSKDGGRQKGFGTDAVKSMTKYAFDELRLNCVFAHILSYNNASVRLFQKCGFKCDGTLRSRVYKNGEYVDVYAYSILKSDLYCTMEE